MSGPAPERRHLLGPDVVTVQGLHGEGHQHQDVDDLARDAGGDRRDRQSSAAPIEPVDDHAEGHAPDQGRTELMQQQAGRQSADVDSLERGVSEDEGADDLDRVERPRAQEDGEDGMTTTAMIRPEIWPAMAPATTSCRSEACGRAATTSPGREIA